MANIETQLEERIRFLFEELEQCDPGSDRHKILSEELQKLYDIRNDEIRIHAEEAKAYDINEVERMRLDFDKEKAEAEKRRFVKDKAIDIGKTAISIGASAALTRKILKFEETGVLTSKSWTQCIPKLNFLK